MKVIKAGETVNYLNRDHIIEDVTEQGVKLKRVNALPNEYAIYIRKGSDRFFKIFSKDFNVEDIETTIEDGVDVRLEKTEKKSEVQLDEDKVDLNDFIVNLTKKHTDFNDKEEVTEYLRAELFDFSDVDNALKRFVISCWLNRRILVKFQTDDIAKALSKVKERQVNYTDELRLFIESALGDITAPSAKELKSLVSLIPEEDEDLLLSVIKGFDLPLLWLNQTEVKQMLQEADEASKTNINKGKNIMAKTIKGLSDETVLEMAELFTAEAETRGLNEDVADDAEDDVDLEAMNLKELRAYCKENEIDIDGAKTKKAILDILFAEEDEDEDEITDEEAEDIEEDEDEDETEEAEEEEEDDAEDDEEFEDYTEEELDEMTLKDLREIADEDFEIEGAKKMKKPALVEAILDAQGDDEDEEDEEDEDEMPDFASMSLAELRAECKEEGIDTKGLKKPALVEELEALYE